MNEQVGTDDLNGYRSRIGDFVVDTFKGHSIREDEDIFATGFVNSLFALELVTFIEGSFQITVESEDLDLENFRTVARMAEFVARKVGNDPARAPL